MTGVRLCLTWVALHLAGEERRCVGQRDAHKEPGCYFHSSWGTFRTGEKRASSKILSIKLPTYSFKSHLNENEGGYGSSKLNSLVSALTPSLFLSSLHRLSSPCVGIYMSMTYALVPFSFFFSPIYMSVAFAARRCSIKMKVICSATVRLFYQLLLSSILVSEHR